MQKCLLFLLIFMVLGLVCADPIRVLGINISSTPAYAVVPYLTNIVFTKVSTTDFATVNLNNYDVLFIAESFTNGSVTAIDTTAMAALKSREADIATWLNAGHGLVALSEPFSSPYDWLPNAIQPTFSAHNGYDALQIAMPLHPVMQNLTNASLSGWGCSSHGGLGNSAGLDVLVTSTSGDIVTLAGNYGSGRVFLTLQDPDWHFPAGGGNITLVQNAINWTALAVPEPSSVFLCAIGMIVFALIRRR